MKMASEARVEVEKTDSGALVRAAGEIDISNISIFRQAMEQAQEAGEGRLTVDLCNVTFIDTAGLAELIIAAKRLKNKGETLRVVVRESSQPEYVLKTTGLDVILDICYPAAG